MTEAEGFQGLHSTLVANCAVNAFLSLTAVVLNVITTSAPKNSVVVKDFKNITPESRCFWSWGWFACSTSLYSKSCNRNWSKYAIWMQRSMYFPYFSCFWDVVCHTVAWELLLESLVNLSCDGICCIIFWHWCIWIHLSILWSTVGRCETFDKLWLVYFVTSFKVIKAHLRLVVPLEFWTFYDVISMVCKSVDHGKLWSIC